MQTPAPPWQQGRCRRFCFGGTRVTFSAAALWPRSGFFQFLAWLLAVMLCTAPTLLASNPEYRFTQVELESCYDGDTCRFTLVGEHPLLGKNIPVRLLGIDTPEMEARCLAEQRAAAKAQQALEAKLRKAKQLEIRVKAKDAYGRLLGRVFADKADVGQWMLDKGYARPYVGGSRKGWCD